MHLSKITASNSSNSLGKSFRRLQLMNVQDLSEGWWSNHSTSILCICLLIYQSLWHTKQNRDSSLLSTIESVQPRSKRSCQGRFGNPTPYPQSGIPPLPYGLTLQKLPPEDIPIWVTIVRKVMIEDGAILAQISHILQLIVRHSELFYPFSALFLPTMVSNLHRSSMHNSPTLENRQLSLKVVSLILNWEKKRYPIIYQA